jgi:hypothetical protein
MTKTTFTDKMTGREGEEGEAEDAAVRSYGIVVWNKLSGNIEDFLPPCTIPEIQTKCRAYKRDLPADVDAGNLGVVIVPVDVWSKMQQLTMGRWWQHQFTLFRPLHDTLMQEYERERADREWAETSTYYKPPPKEEDSSDNQFFAGGPFMRTDRWGNR